MDGDPPGTSDTGAPSPQEPSVPHNPPRLVQRWESLLVQAQFGIAWLVAAALLAVGHIALFPRITTARALGYAVFEAILVAGLVVLATQAERQRRGGTDDGQ